MYESWSGDNSDIAMHRSWVSYVLTSGLEIPLDHIVDTGHIPQELQFRVPMQHETLMPDFAVIEPSEAGSAPIPRMIVMVVPPNQSLDKPLPNKQWNASPHTRMSDLVRGCNKSGIYFGVVTNGSNGRWSTASKGKQPASLLGMHPSGSMSLLPSEHSMSYSPPNDCTAIRTLRWKSFSNEAPNIKAKSLTNSAFRSAMPWKLSSKRSIVSTASVVANCSRDFPKNSSMKHVSLS